MLKKILLCIMILFIPSTYAQGLTKKEQSIVYIVSQHGSLCFLKTAMRTQISHLKKAGMSKQEALTKFAVDNETKLMVYEIYDSNGLSDEIDYFDNCMNYRNSKLQ